MSSFQNPARLLGVTTLLCGTLFGCALNQDSTPLVAESSPGALAAERSTTPESSTSPSDQTDPFDTGISPDADSINAILDEMLAGHEALKVRKAEELSSEPSSPGSLSSPASESESVLGCRDR